MMELKRQVDRKELRDFGLLVGLFLSFLFGGIIPWQHHQALPLWPWAIAGFLWLFAAAMPVALGPIYRVWMLFGSVMGWINTRIILAVVFFAMVMPIGWLARVIFKQPLLQIALDDSAQSYRVLSQPKSKNSVEKPF